MTRFSLACLAAVLLPDVARAAPPLAVQLAWSSDDASCIDSATLARTVERTLNVRVFDPSRAPSARIVGRIGPAVATSGTEKPAGGYVAQVSLIAQGGQTTATRTLTTASNCRSLDESVAVVITLMVDELASANRDEASPPASSASTSTTSPSHSTDGAPVKANEMVPVAPLGADTRSPSAASTVKWFGEGALGLVGGGALGLLPNANVSAALRGEIDVVPQIPVALVVRSYGPESALSDASVGGKFWGWTAEVAACPEFRWERIRLGACAGFGAGTMTGTGIGLSDERSYVRPLLLVSALPSLRVRIAGPLWARLDAGVVLPLLRDNWEFKSDSTGSEESVLKVGAVAGLADVGLEVHLGR